MKVVGWTDAYGGPYKETFLTEEKKQALIDCIRYKHYNFSYNDLCFLPNCAPFFEDKTISIPSKKEWKEIIDKAYTEENFTKRLIPLDALKRQPINDILYERKEDEPIGENNNG